MKKINDNIFKRAVSFLLLLSLVVVFSFVPINDTSAAEATAGLKVNATSNYFPTASTTVDGGEEYVTVTYFMNSPKDVFNVQWTLTYDPAYLEFAEADNMNAANRSNLMPMVDDLVWNADGKNYIKANASALELYKFAGKGLVPFATVTFKVIGSGETTVDLNVEVLTLSLPDSETQMTDSGQEEIVIKNGVVDEANVHTGRETSVDAGLYNPDYNAKVSNEEDIIAALNNGVYKIKLAEDITLSDTLDLSDKIITLDLNGHVLTGNIKAADNSETAKSTLYLIDSSTASDGVLEGKIDLTRSCLYANGGTVTGLVSMNDSASKIFCTSDTPTVFNDNVGNFGEIHGGIFYGDINKSCIKEKYVTFMNGEDTYAYEVVSSDNNAVAPVEPDQAKYGYQNFDGWYNGEAAYAFGSSLSEDITLTAKFSSPATFNITYDLDGGTATNPISYNVESDTITLNNPTKTGYTFTGWSGTDLTGDDNVTVTIPKGSMGSRGYTAHFSPNSYTVSFDTVGGSTISDKTGLMWTDEVLDGVTAPTKDGWEFTGWKYADKPVTANTKYSDLVTDDKIAGITLVAQWKDINAPTGEISIGTKKWTEFRDDITFSLFFKDKQTVTITASDNVTTSPTIKYYLSDKKLTESEVNAEDIAWETYTGAFDITADGKKIIYAKVTDDAGKVTIVNSEGIVIYKDSTPAVADIRYTYKENANKSVAISLNGNTIKAITNGTKALTKDTDYTVSADGTVTIMAAYLDTLAASDAPYTLTITYNPQGVEYTGGEESVAPAQTTISVTVAKADNAPNMPDSTKSVSYSTKKVGAVELPDNWAWEEEAQDTVLEVGTPVTATAVYTGADKGNYKTESVEISITRQACTHEGCETEVRDTREATCTEGGYTGDTYCKVCGIKIASGSETAKKQHTLTKTEQKVPTCTATGLKAYWTCSVCGKHFADEEGNTEVADLADLTVDKTEHTWDEGKVTKEPTAKEAGEKTFTCGVCGTTRIEEIPEQPFIKGEDGKTGWDVIKDQIADAIKELEESGSTDKAPVITIDMNGTTTVPKEIFDDIKGKDVTIVLDMGDDVAWTIDGKDVTEVPEGEIDFGVQTGTDTIPVDVINNVTGERYSMQIGLNHDGEFGFKAVLTVNLEEKNAGYFANLFYYNEQTQELEFMTYGKINEDGSVDLEFKHASDYVIIIDDKPLDGSATEEPRTEEPTTEKPTTETPTTETPTTETPTTEKTAAENSTTETPAVTVTQAEIQENSVKLNIGTSLVWKKDQFTISWETISGADGYDIVAAKCGAKMTSKSLVKTVKGEKSSAALTKIAGKKLSGKEEYKVRIKAYKLINGKKVYIGSSQFYHMAGKNNKTFTNAKKITVSKKSVTLKVGKTSQIKAKIVKQSKKKKLLPKGHGPALRYCSTDNSIATVTAKGKITAKEKGSCYIYVIALNGVKTKIKVKVK